MKIIVLCVLSLLSVGEALQCYNCENNDCAKVVLVGCDTTCVKITTGTGEDAKIVNQHCWPDKMADNCTTSEIRGVKNTLCYCNTDFCNSSTTITLALSVMALVPLIHYFF